MSTVLDNTVAVLHGSARNTLHWVWLSKSNGTVSVANVSDSGFWLRDYTAEGCPGLGELAKDLPRLWSYHVAGVDLSKHATHHLAPPHMQTIEPLPAPEPSVADEFGTEAML